MTQFSLFWNTNGFDGDIGDGAAAYSQDEYRTYSRTHFPNGVIYDPGGDNLVASGTASPLSVSPGKAWVQGFFFTSDDDEDLAVTTPTTGTTGGRIVVRANWATSTARLFVKLSSDGNASIPALTQTDGTTYEESVATFSVTTGGVITVTLDQTFSNVALTSTMLSVTGSYNNTDASQPLDSSAGYGLAMPDAKLSRVLSGFKTPADAQLGLPMTLSALFFNVVTASNNVVLNARILESTSGLATTTTDLLTSEVVAVTGPSSRTLEVVLGEISSLLEAESLVLLSLNRDGANGSDNFAGELIFLTFVLEYWRLV